METEHINESAYKQKLYQPSRNTAILPLVQAKIVNLKRNEEQDPHPNVRQHPYAQQSHDFTKTECDIMLGDQHQDDSQNKPHGYIQFEKLRNDQIEWVKKKTILLFLRMTILAQR